MLDRSVTSRGPTTALVGREREQALLRGCMTEMLAGHGHLVLIGGEAGIGKTALAEACCREATAAGALVLTGRCYDLADTPPYGPWLELFARYRASGALPVLPTAFAQRGAISEVTSQTALFLQVEDFFTALATHAPFVLFFDDLHWSDPASLDLLRFIARRLSDIPALLLATYRGDELTRAHPLTPLLPTLVREASATRLNLHRLRMTDIAVFVGGRYLLSGDDARRLEAYLSERSEGNPFFLGELARTLEEEAVVYPDDEGWHLGDLTQVRVPALLRNVIDGRLARLGAAAQEILAIGAVIGQDVPLPLWEAVTDVSTETFLDAIERAGGARILEESPDGTRARFVHALIREALYEGIVPSRRRLWHLRIAETLVTEDQSDPDAVAYHFRQAGDTRAAEWLVKAGERAQRAYAWLTAADRFEAAAEIMETSSTARDVRDLTLYRLAMLRRYANPQQSVTHLNEVMQSAASMGDHILAAEALFACGRLHMGVGEVSLGLAEMAAGIAALENLPEQDAERRIRLIALGVSADLNDYRGTYSLHLAHAGRYAEAQAIAERVIAEPPLTAQMYGLFGALSVDAHGGLEILHTMLGRIEEARRASLHFNTTNSVLGNDYLVYRNSVWFVRVLMLGYYADKVAERHTIYAKADEAGARAGGILPSDDVNGRLDRLPVLLVEGRWEEARGLISLLGKAEHVYDYKSDIGKLAYYQGDTVLAWQIVNALLPHGPQTVPGSTRFLLTVESQRLATLLSLEADDLPTARAWLETHDRWFNWNSAVLGRSEGAALWARYYRQDGNQVQAREYAHLAFVHATEPRQPLALLAANRLLGELSTEAGHYDDAATHLKVSLALADACAAPYERALTLLALAELYAATNNRAGAHVLLDDVRAICTPLGAKPALARADTLAAQLTIAAAPRRNPAGLTAREIEVLRLVVAGRTNQEIADILSVSRNTVMNHVTHILTKTNAENRAAAAAFALRNGLA